MQISKRAQYGLRAMVYLAKNKKKGDVIPLKKISKTEAIPFNFLEKIIGQLEKAGLVDSRKGVQGGYFLSKPTNKITVGQIVLVLEKTTTPVNCSLCNRAKKCLSRNVWQKVQTSLNKTMDSINLAQLIK